MKRWHEEYSRTHREWKKHYLVHVESNINYNRDPFKIDCICDQQKGRFRKIKNLDCGVPQCWLCHSDKFPVREKTRKELIADLKLEEGISELKGIE